MEKVCEAYKWRIAAPLAGRMWWDMTFYVKRREGKSIDRTSDISSTVVMWHKRKGWMVSCPIIRQIKFTETRRHLTIDGSLNKKTFPIMKIETHRWLLSRTIVRRDIRCGKRCVLSTYLMAHTESIARREKNWWLIGQRGIKRAREFSSWEKTRDRKGFPTDFSLVLFSLSRIEGSFSNVSRKLQFSQRKIHSISQCISNWSLNYFIC